MKVIHVGNLANTPYRCVKALRRRGIDAELMIPYIRDLTEDPKSEDPDIYEFGMPEWIHVSDNRYRFRHHPWSRISLIKKVREYDIIHSYTEMSIFAMFSLKPYIAHSTGSDLRELALENTFMGTLMRWAFKRSRIVLFQNCDQIPIIKRLKIRNVRYMPIPIDTEKFAPYESDELRLKYNSDVIIYHPTAQDWRLKGNQLFFKAFARLVKEAPYVHLIAVDWGVDGEKTKELVRKLQITKHVSFIPFVKLADTVKYYNASDIIVDQFILGSFGAVCLEAMSCSKPVVMQILEDVVKLCYSETPPLINAANEEEIFQKLLILVTDKSERMKIGKQSREWVVKCHGFEAVSEKLLNVYRHFK